jgi:methylenetetrahydrofolate reductase (NADPH)
MYKIYTTAHVLMFEDNFFLRMIRPIIRFIDSKRGLNRTWHFLEKMAKEPLFDCMNCGDCGLTDVAYICPMSQCPKNQRNGPCGGSQNDWCEVYPEQRKCVWIRAYQRFGSSRALEKEAGSKIVLPQDWQLSQTASWLNFNLGRDHASKKAYLDIKK